MNKIIESIKQLRNDTGAGVMECRKALEQFNLDYGEACAYLKKNAELNAAKRMDREARQGKIELYAHNNGRIGVMVEINTETEFASRSETFRRFANEIALQITATSPFYVRDEDIPPALLTDQRQAVSDAARAAGKPEELIEQIVSGTLEKYKNTHVLLRQVYIRDENISVAQLLNRTSAQIGENIIIRRFLRWEICPDETEQTGLKGSPDERHESCQ